MGFSQGATIANLESKWLANESKMRLQGPFLVSMGCRVGYGNEKTEVQKGFRNARRKTLAFVPPKPAPKGRGNQWGGGNAQRFGHIGAETDVFV